MVGDLDRWERSRITAQTKQAGGRLRGTRPRRTGSGEKLTHDIHSNFVFSSDHGFQIDEVITDAAFQTRDSLNAGRTAERRAVIGLAAALRDWVMAGRTVKAPGRDKVNGYLRAKKLNEISPKTWPLVSKCISVQALYNIYTMPVRISEKTGESAYMTDLYGESVSTMYQAAVGCILSEGGDPADPAAIRWYFDKMVDSGEYSSDLEVVEGLLMESAATIREVLATGTEGIS
jgi:hypothetical protein